SGNYSPVSGMHIEVWSSTGGPPGSATWLLIDGKDSNLAVPGLCARLHALPTIMLPVGKTTALGEVTKKHLSFPFIAGLQGANLVTQLLTLAPAQPGLPFGITDGQQARMPSYTGTHGHAAVYLHGYSSNSSTLSLGVFYGGAPVAELR
ncbi:MAG TPA: hypothetical protein VKA04_11895, partial [Pseudodesulfovibrio sp.]|nr:hypothetical protein [Pseudodesulfovibrio sp.]